MAPGNRHSITRVSLALLGGFALLVPGVPSQLLAPGLPLSAAGLVCAMLLAYATLALPTPGWSRARWLVLGLGFVIGLKLTAGGLAPPVGLNASYWARALPEGPPERSTDFPWLRDPTRIDTRLDLRGEDFPVHFFNDASRFNFGSDVQPARDQLPFSVAWQGWVVAPSDGERQFLLTSTGPARVWLDDVELPSPSDDARMFLTRGLHALRVEYTRPEARVPRLRLSWQRVVGGELVPMGAEDVRWQANAGSAQLSNALGAAADALLAASMLGWLALGLARVPGSQAVARAVLGALPVVFLLHGMLLHAPFAGRSTILSGLDDWLIYESSARDILLNGVLMNGGQDSALPYYGQPLYPYVLALAHRLSGESLFGPLAMQFAALGALVALTALLARRAFGSAVDGLAALGCLCLLLQFQAEHFKVARQLFNENLYMPLVVGSLAAVVRMAGQSRPPAWWKALLLGSLLGLTAITRSQFLLFVPFGLLILIVAWRKRAGWALGAVAAVVIGMCAVIAPVTARNWLVSGKLVLISSGTGASLLEFHRPPPGLIDQAAIRQDPLYEALHLDMQTRTVVAFLRADPRGYLGTVLPPGAHSIGLQGRNDLGVYWPLFVTVLGYVASFGFRQVRRLHVWPIHAFVATHLLVMMLFEADTYGYRLVMPMYAPMMAIAAQLPLAAIRGLVRSRSAAFMRSGDPVRAERFAKLGWSAIAAAALVWQARGLVDIWPQRDAVLHGLAGPAALAASTADQVGAEAIYVASIDGTPRRFGAGNLPGLRYPWFKWFDPVRSVPLPAPSTSAVYMLSELNSQRVPGDLVACLGPPDERWQIVLSGAQVRERCVGSWPPTASVDVRFDGVARIEALVAPEAIEAGEPLEARLVWQPLANHPADAYQLSLQLDDPSADDGTLLGNSTLEVYPARQWDTGESLLSRLPLATDPTAIPHQYRLTVGMGPLRANAPPVRATWQGAQRDRVPVASVMLSPSTSLAAHSMPADMRPVEGPRTASHAGIELVGARPLPAETAIGGPLKIGLLWRATTDAPDIAQFKVRLLRQNGEVVQESTLPLLGGRIKPTALRAGNVVRDEHTLLISGRVPTEPVTLELDVLDDLHVSLGSLEMTGRARRFDAAAAAQATFGDAIDLIEARVEPASAKSGEKISVKLRWRSARDLSQAYKVFVHVLDPGGQQVVAQRDAEPLDGRAPTTGWVPGEVIDDEYAIALPTGLVAGSYPIEIGVYDPRSGARLMLDNGENRLILDTPLRIR